MTTSRHANELVMKNRLSIGGKCDRLPRTIVLGALTVLVAIIWLSKELGMDRDELLGYLGTSLLFVAISIGLGVVAGGLVWLVKKFRG